MPRVIQAVPLPDARFPAVAVAVATAVAVAVAGHSETSARGASFWAIRSRHPILYMRPAAAVLLETSTIHQPGAHHFSRVPDQRSITGRAIVGLVPCSFDATRLERARVEERRGAPS